MYNYSENRYLTEDEQLALLPAELREYWKKTKLNVVTMDGMEIQGYFEYSYLDEKSYNKQPKRSIGGRVDLSTYTSFLTSHLLIKFKYMHIEDYRKVMELINSKDEITVECYDIVADTRVTRKMYVKPQKMPLIHQLNLQVLGVRDMDIELVGTNMENDVVTVQYNYNLPADAMLHFWKQDIEEYVDIPFTETSATHQFPLRSSNLFGEGATILNTVTQTSIPVSLATLSANGVLYKFKYWSEQPNTNDDKNGFHYIDGDAYYLKQPPKPDDPIKVYAQWEVSKSSDANLSNLSVDNYTISPDFDKQTLTYNIKVPSTINSITVNATPADANATVVISGGSYLVYGMNVVNITVKAQAGNVQVYSIIVEKEKPAE